MKSNTNTAFQLKMKLMGEIAELLKARGIQIDDLGMRFKTFKTKKTKVKQASTTKVAVSGTIVIKITSFLNKDLKFETEDEQEEEMLDDDYLNDMDKGLSTRVVGTDDDDD